MVDDHRGDFSPLDRRSNRQKHFVATLLRFEHFVGLTDRRSSSLRRGEELHRMRSRHRDLLQSGLHNSPHRSTRRNERKPNVGLREVKASRSFVDASTLPSFRTSACDEAKCRSNEFCQDHWFYHTCHCQRPFYGDQCDLSANFFVSPFLHLSSCV